MLPARHINAISNQDVHWIRRGRLVTLWLNYKILVTYTTLGVPGILYRGVGLPGLSYRPLGDAVGFGRYGDSNLIVITKTGCPAIDIGYRVKLPPCLKGLSQDLPCSTAEFL
jgi:hypothetical protein